MAAAVAGASTSARGMTTASALSKILAQDTADLLDENVHSKYSNRRNAKLQVRGEKEVLHHFALWARTAM